MMNSKKLHAKFQGTTSNLMLNLISYTQLLRLTSFLFLKAARGLMAGVDTGFNLLLKVPSKHQRSGSG